MLKKKKKEITKKKKKRKSKNQNREGGDKIGPTESFVEMLDSQTLRIEDISFIRSWIKRVIPCFPFSRVDFLIFVNLCQFYINHERREEGEGGKRGQINE